MLIRDKIRSCGCIGHKIGEHEKERIAPVFIFFPIFHAKLSAYDIGAVRSVPEQCEWMKALDTVSAGVGAKQVIDKPADLRLRNVKLIFNDERHFSADNVENLGKCWNLGI